MPERCNRGAGHIESFVLDIYVWLLSPVCLFQLIMDRVNSLRALVNRGR